MNESLKKIEKSCKFSYPNISCDIGPHRITRLPPISIIHDYFFLCPSLSCSVCEFVRFVIWLWIKSWKQRQHRIHVPRQYRKFDLIFIIIIVIIIIIIIFIIIIIIIVVIIIIIIITLIMIITTILIVINITIIDIIILISLL